MKKFSIKETFKKAWGIWRANKLILTPLTVFVFVVGMIYNPAENVLAKTIFEIVLFVATTFVGMGYLKTLLLIESGEKVEFGEIFKHAKYFWRYLLASLIYGFIVSLGVLLFIIPGIYFALKYFFVLTLIVDKDLKIGEAFTQAGLLTDGVKWKILGFWGVSVLVAILGALALGVGLLVASPVIGLASVVIYRKLSQEVSEPVRELEGTSQ